MARIFARALNLSDDLQERDAIGQAILRGNDLDVIEIDGASNRGVQERSEEHTSELQSRRNLVCRLLLEKKKRQKQHI